MCHALLIDTQYPVRREVTGYSLCYIVPVNQWSQVRFGFQIWQHQLGWMLKAKYFVSQLKVCVIPHVPLVIF